MKTIQVTQAMRDSIKILIVEDEKSMRKALEETLKRRYKEISSAEDGLKGLQMYERVKPDIMLIDIRIPEIDGLELARRIRATDIRTEIVIVSACDDRDTILESVDLCLSGYIIKPFDGQELIKAVDACILKRLKKEGTYQARNVRHSDKIPFLTGNNVLVLNGKNYSLRDNEYRFIELLLRNGEGYTSKETILFEVWDNKIVSEQALYSTIKRLRKKVPALKIKNEKGLGYRLDLDFD